MKGVESMSRGSGQVGCGRSVRMRAFTLTEILVTIAIIALLAAMASVGMRAVTDSAKKTASAAAMRVIASAIDEYSRFWPAPKGRATAGFPEWDYWYLWDQSEDPNDFDPDELDVPEDGDDWSRTGCEANECLTYALLSPRGGGPYLKNPPSDMVATLVNPKASPPGVTSDFAQKLADDPDISSKPSVGVNVPVRRLLDPWGTPYVYQWLDVADQPVVTAGGNLAVKYRLICAGPNKKFGNTGTDSNISDDQRSQAADNIYFGPAPRPTDVSLFPIP